MTKELIRKFSDEIEQLTLKRVDIALDTIRYRRHNPEKGCACDICRLIWEIRQEIGRVFKDKKVGNNNQLNKQ